MCDGKIFHFEELSFTVVAITHDYYVDYVIYDHEGEDSEGNFLFHKKDSKRYPDPVESIVEADVFIHGEVKWDGCSHWYFDEQDNCMLHGCCKKDIIRFGLILGECYELTKKLCVDWCNWNE